MTDKDRLDELTNVPEEHKLLAVTIFEAIGAVTYDKTPFFECLRWFGLAGSLRAFWQSIGALNLINGTTSPALAIMRESRADILLSSSISSVSTLSGASTVTTRSGQVFQAPQVISTLPVNCLEDVAFTPAIDAKKLAAAKEPHLTKFVKMHTYTKATLKATLTSATGVVKDRLRVHGSRPPRPRNWHLLGLVRLRNTPRPFPPPPPHFSISEH
jgi:hypothetical protein